MSEVSRSALGQGGLQRGKIGGPIVVEGDHLPINDASWKLRAGVSDSRELGGPVETFASSHFCLALAASQLHAITVQLDLVDPLLARRRPTDSLAELGWNKSGHSRLGRSAP